MRYSPLSRSTLNVAGENPNTKDSSSLVGLSLFRSCKSPLVVQPKPRLASYCVELSITLSDEFTFLDFNEPKKTSAYDL